MAEEKEITSYNEERTNNYNNTGPTFNESIHTTEPPPAIPVGTQVHRAVVILFEKTKQLNAEQKNRMRDLHVAQEVIESAVKQMEDLQERVSSIELALSILLSGAESDEAKSEYAKKVIDASELHF